MRHLKKFNESADPLYYAIDLVEFGIDVINRTEESSCLRRLREMLMDQCGLKDSQIGGVHDNTLKHVWGTNGFLNMYLFGLDIYIYELVDEWFVCEIYSNDDDMAPLLFKCDQWEGLLEFLKSFGLKF